MYERKCFWYLQCPPGEQAEIWGWEGPRWWWLDFGVCRYWALLGGSLLHFLCFWHLPDALINYSTRQRRMTFRSSMPASMSRTGQCNPMALAFLEWSTSVMCLAATFYVSFTAATSVWRFRPRGVDSRVKSKFCNKKEILLTLKFLHSALWFTRVARWCHKPDLCGDWSWRERNGLVASSTGTIRCALDTWLPVDI